MLPTPFLQNKSPYEVLFKQASSYSHLEPLAALLMLVLININSHQELENLCFKDILSASKDINCLISNHTPFSFLGT